VLDRPTPGLEATRPGSRIYPGEGHDAPPADHLDSPTKTDLSRPVLPDR
jgi:hypothetical protein